MEEALLHYFDPSKKEQKFEYQPPQEPSSQTQQSASSTELEIASGRGRRSCTATKFTGLSR